MNTVVILWHRNGWAGPEWKVHSVHGSLHSAQKTKGLLLTKRSTSKDLGNEFKIESFGVIND